MIDSRSSQHTSTHDRTVDAWLTSLLSLRMTCACFTVESGCSVSGSYVHSRAFEASRNSKTSGKPSLKVPLIQGNLAGGHQIHPGEPSLEVTKFIQGSHHWRCHSSGGTIAGGHQIHPGEPSLEVPLIQGSHRWRCHSSRGAIAGGASHPGEPSLDLGVGARPQSIYALLVSA